MLHKWTLDRSETKGCGGLLVPPYPLNYSKVRKTNGHASSTIDSIAIDIKCGTYCSSVHTI